MSSSQAGRATARVFRLPRLAYVAVLFLLFCAAPVAFSSTGGDTSGTEYGPRLAVLLVPLLAIVFIARTATIVDGAGLVVRAILGRRTLAWDRIRGLSVSGRSVYAVLDDGAVRLPCVRVADLAAMSRASSGRLPEFAEPVAKSAPSRRSRRR
jgi:Bacterial PH domain